MPVKEGVQNRLCFERVRLLYMSHQTKQERPLYGLLARRALLRIYCIHTLMSKTKENRREVGLLVQPSSKSAVSVSQSRRPVSCKALQISSLIKLSRGTGASGKAQEHAGTTGAHGRDTGRTEGTGGRGHGEAQCARGLAGGLAKLNKHIHVFHPQVARTSGHLRGSAGPCGRRWLRVVGVVGGRVGGKSSATSLG